jgi:flagellin-like protein
VRQEIEVLRIRRGVSELYASILMVGVTLAFGGIVTSLAAGQFDSATTAGALGARAQISSAGKQVSLVYGTVAGGSGGCTATYRGPDGGTYQEGKDFTLVLYDYGSVSFTPYEAFDNGTLLSVGGYATVAASAGGQAAAPTSNTLSLPTCARPTGQAILLIDASGDEVSIGT